MKRRYALCVICALCDFSCSLKKPKKKKRKRTRACQIRKSAKPKSNDGNGLGNLSLSLFLHHFRKTQKAIMLPLPSNTFILKHCIMFFLEIGGDLSDEEARGGNGRGGCEA